MKGPRHRVFALSCTLDVIPIDALELDTYYDVVGSREPFNETPCTWQGQLKEQAGVLVSQSRTLPSAPL